MKTRSEIQKPGRRKFITNASIAFSGLTILPSFVIGGKKSSPNDKLNIAGIGVGGVGKAYLNGAAINKGLHVYCAKPLTLTIYESHVLAREAKKAGIATQMSTQSDAMESYRLIREWIWEGAIGDVNEVQIWEHRP